MQTVHIGILVGYLVVMVLVGAWFSRARHVSTGDDFVFAGRRLPRAVLVGTLLATWVGSGTIIGGANFAYTYGPLASMLFFAGTPLGILVLYLAAARIRAASRYTVPELLEARFGTGARMVAAAVTLLAYVGITAYQFTGGGYIVSLITPLSPEQGTIVVAVLVTFLAIGGGLFSVAYTDFLSALVIVGSLLVALPIVLGELGGLGGYWAALGAEQRSVSGGLSAVQLLGYFLPLFLLILADQNMYQRLTAARDEGTARSSTAGFFFSTFLVTVPVALLASAASVLLPDLASADTAVLSLASEGYLPAVLGGLVLAGALAFIVTTGSSFLLSGAGNVVYDLYARFSRAEVSDRRRLHVHRLAVAVIAVVAYLLGQFFPTVLELQIYSYTIYGVAITPVVLAVLFWRRATKAGALASMLVGTAVTITWEVTGGFADVNGVLLALPSAVLALVVVSLLTRPSAEERQVVTGDGSAKAR